MCGKSHLVSMIQLWGFIRYVDAMITVDVALLLISHLSNVNLPSHVLTLRLQSSVLRPLSSISILHRPFAMHRPLSS